MLFAVQATLLAYALYGFIVKDVLAYSHQKIVKQTQHLTFYNHVHTVYMVLLAIILKYVLLASYKIGDVSLSKFYTFAILIRWDVCLRER